MAHNELALDSNIVDVAFSKSGTRIAILMKDHFSVFLWSLKTRPVASPIFESSYPLSDASDSRPRQIAFINENEVYILKSNGPNNTTIERTALETRTTKIAYQAADSEQLVSLLPALNHEALWASHINKHGQPVSYFAVTMPSTYEFEAVPYTQSPSADTYWAKAVQLSEDEVISL
jgi:elongator complex protein 1